MFGTDSNHCQIVRDSIAGNRAVDEKTFASLAVLTERLQHLKNSDALFKDVTFSPDVRKLVGQKYQIAVG